MTTLEHRLEQQIEAAVADFIVATRIKATAAMERAFTARSAPATPKAATSGRRPPASAGNRRPPEELEALGERLCQAIIARPGETMTTLCQDIGEAPKAVRSVVDRLQRDRRIRSAGQRQFTRYYPMTP